MKIAFDATALYGRRGGIENALWHTFAGLREIDQENEYLVYVSSDAPEPPLPVNPLWEWRRLPFRGASKIRRILWQQFELPLVLKREKCDLLHSWNYVMPLGATVPTILTVQDLIALDQSRYATRFNRLHYRLVMPQSLKRASRVIATTEATRSAILRRAPHAQVRVVPLGVDPLFFQTISIEQIAEVRLKYALPEKYLFFVGNFEPKKNLLNLFQALKLKPNLPPLVVAGGIKPWPEIERLLAGTRRIGFVDLEDLPPLYAGCQAFCFPSLCEGFGLPVLEALACGAPVVASDKVPLPGLNQVAVLSNPRSALSIANCIEGLLAEPNFPASRQQRREYSTRFRWETTARQTLEIYREYL